MVWERPSDYLAKAVFYDLLRPPNLTEEHDGLGVLKKRERITYDFAGNQIETADRG